AEFRRGREKAIARLVPDNDAGGLICNFDDVGFRRRDCSSITLRDGVVRRSGRHWTSPSFSQSVVPTPHGEKGSLLRRGCVGWGDSRIAKQFYEADRLFNDCPLSRRSCWPARGGGRIILS